MSLGNKYVTNMKNHYEHAPYAVDHFECDKCLSEKNGMTHGKIQEGADTYVGDNYGSPKRLVFISMDIGKQPDNDRSFEGRRRLLNSLTSKSTLNPHLKGTIETAQLIMSGIAKTNDSSNIDYLKQFALVNSAKCRAKNSSMDKAEPTFFQNCTKEGFVLEEMEILMPDIIVTQGENEPWKSIKKRSFSEINYKNGCEPEFKKEYHSFINCILNPYKTEFGTDSYATKYIEYPLRRFLSVARISTNVNDTLVILSPHPATRGGIWQIFIKSYLPFLLGVIKERIDDLEKIGVNFNRAIFKDV